MNPKKLNVGCGRDIKNGWTNLDSANIPGVDVVHDIEKLPLPFPNETFDEILCQDVLEHVEYIPVMKDLHRILRACGKITIRVPHFTSKNNYIDPTHRRRFSVNTFDFFVRESRLGEKRDYYFDFAFSRITSRRITFEKSSRFFFYNKIFERCVNKSLTRQSHFESTCFSRLFPAENIIVELIK
jgi:ubiquinone/menaquinone biosynthesis C-methylase UbiE